MSPGPGRQPDARLEPEPEGAAPLAEPQPLPEPEEKPPRQPPREAESESHGRGSSEPPFEEEQP